MDCCDSRDRGSTRTDNFEKEIANTLVNNRALNTTSTYSVLLHCSVTDLKVII
jgi:hypothetical protein